MVGVVEAAGEGDVERGKDHNKSMVRRYNEEVKASSTSDAG